MLVYTNHQGMPYNLNVYYDEKDEHPFKLETIDRTMLFRTLDDLISCLEKCEITSLYHARMIKERIQKALSGCQHFPGRKCRGCEYADYPDSFDPYCMYGQDDELDAVNECLG